MSRRPSRGIRVLPHPLTVFCVLALASGEIFPLRTRAKQASLATAFNWLGNCEYSMERRKKQPASANTELYDMLLGQS